MSTFINNEIYGVLLTGDTIYTGSTELSIVINQMISAFNISAGNVNVTQLNTKVSKSGDTMTGDLLLPGLSATSISASTFSAGTINSGTTNLYNIFSTYNTTIGHGINTTTGGSQTFQYVNVTGGSFNNITASGSSSFNILSATTFSAGTINSGTTNLYSIFASVDSDGVTWTEVTTTSQTATVNGGYITNNASLVTVTLPLTSVIGKTIRVGGKGLGGWKITQNANQFIIFGNKRTTTGTGGYLASVVNYDSLELLCLTANTVWSVISSVGNITIV